MQPDQVPLPKFHLTALIPRIMIWLAALYILIGSSIWFIAQSQLFIAGVIDEDLRREILMEFLQPAGTSVPFPSTSHSNPNEELRILAKIITRLEEMVELEYEKKKEKMLELEEKDARIRDVLREIREKRNKLMKEALKNNELYRQHNEAGRYEEFSKLDEKIDQINDEVKCLIEAANPYIEELKRIGEEHSTIKGEVRRNDEMLKKFKQEFERRLMEEERKQIRYLSCRDQYRRNDPEYNGDSDSD